MGTWIPMKKEPRGIRRHEFVLRRNPEKYGDMNNDKDGRSKEARDG
jgi:hypothetical protein